MTGPPTADDVLAGDLAAERRQVQLRVDDLGTELAAIAESTAQTPDDEHDAEGSTIGYERARITALLAQARRDLAACDNALRRVQLGSYRTCTRCGGQIPAERLVALPATVVCVGCARAS
ncbi:MAG: TraR/DksA family transcriptional regulator [Acidimicrobiales bacterium]